MGTPTRRTRRPRRPQRAARTGCAFCVGACLALLLALACGGNAENAVPPAANAPEESPVPQLDEATADTSDGARPRGLWVLCEGSQRVLDDPARVETLIEDAVALGATDLFVQVYRGGRAWYDSSRADAAPYRTILERTGVDTLALLLERASAAGLRVHGWVNVLSLHGHADAPVVRELGRDAVHVDQRGRSLLDYPGFEVPPPDGDWYRMGTRGVYLDPAAPGVSDWLAATFAELVARYPALAGLHLDYIRHPDILPFIPGSRFGVGLDVGYGEASRARFRQETGLEAPFQGRLSNASRWDDWRREQVTELVAAIRREAQAARPGLLLSAAVASHADRAYLSLYQDWRGWLEAGLLDVAVPMTYTLDDRLFRYQVEDFASGPRSDRIWIGIGSWLFAQRPERALEQIGIAREAGSSGDALFSYDAIADAPALRAALAEPSGGG